MKVPFLDLDREYSSIKDEIQDSIRGVFNSSRFILGDNVKALEEEIAKYIGAKHAIGVASGTDALLLSFMALGIGKGDEVITTPFTFFATAGAVTRTGATVKFVDVDNRTYNIDPDKIRDAVTKNTKAIAPVHLFGQSADIKEIMQIASENNLFVIEDACQSIGAEYDAKKVGSFSIGCFSFFPTKNLSCYGDGGIVTTNDDKIAEKIRMLRVHGAKPKYFHSMIGINSRLDELQAAILRVKLKYLDEWNTKRNTNAKTYNELLRNIKQIKTPFVSKGCKHVYNQYAIQAENRDKLMESLSSKNISAGVYYPLSLHLQKCYSCLGYKKGSIPVSEFLPSKILSLPMFPELKKEEIEYVSESIKEFYNIATENEVKRN